MKKVFGKTQCIRKKQNYMQPLFDVLQIKLQYPDEYIVNVSGYYCPVVHGGTPFIRSLTFQTNKRTFGPFGIEVGTPFSFPVERGLIVGFKGRSDWYLDAIGFHVSRVQTPKFFQRVQKGFQRLTNLLIQNLASKDVGSAA